MALALELKRILGYINFHANRRHFNDPSLVHALVADLKQQSIDHIAVTGDLANLGMPKELQNSLRWLESVGPPDEVTAIPGNHDIYTPLWRDIGVERWRPYMQARGPADAVPNLPAPLATGFPFVRTIGRFALIGLNSAVHMPPGVAAGRVGPEQIARFCEMSQVLHNAGFTRIVLIHHPPLPEHGPRALRDGVAFDRALLDVGAELVVHGHNHRAMLSWRSSATGPVPIVGAGAAGNGVYNLYEIQREVDGSCSIEVVTRSSPRASEPFTETHRARLQPNLPEQLPAL